MIHCRCALCSDPIVATPAAPVFVCGPCNLQLSVKQSDQVANLAERWIEAAGELQALSVRLEHAMIERSNLRAAVTALAISSARIASGMVRTNRCKECGEPSQ